MKLSTPSAGVNGTPGQIVACSPFGGVISGGRRSAGERGAVIVDNLARGAVDSPVHFPTFVARLWGRMIHLPSLSSVFCHVYTIVLVSLSLCGRRESIVYHILGEEELAGQLSGAEMDQRLVRLLEYSHHRIG